LKRRLLARAAWTLAAAVVLVLLFKTLVGDVYHVQTSSMEPTIWGIEGNGEWWFVRFDRTPPERNEVVVIRRPEDSTPIVKRVLGCPKETLRISQGDVLIDRQQLRPSEPRPPEVVLFDDRWHRLEDRFAIGEAQSRVWRREGDAWKLDARAIPLHDDAALPQEAHAAEDASILRWNGPLDDGYLGPDHQLVPGTTQANDARIECDVRFDDDQGEVRLGLKEQADTFEGVLTRESATTAKVAITRRAGTEPPVEVGTAHFPLVTGKWVHLSFENRDNALKLLYPGPGAQLVQIYKQNTPEPDGAASSGRGPSGRAYFGGAGGRISFRSIRLARDQVYTDRGHVGVDSEIQLGLGQYFLLGDNSAQSKDSREWGPVEEGDIVGRAVRVVWPPSRWRRIDMPVH
jgi:type IV secretory pathway protease TraF